MRSKGLWNALRNWLEFRPEDMDDRTARAYVMARAAFPIGFLTHVALCLVFLHLGSDPLFLFNIASSIIWGYGLWRVNWHGEFNGPFLLCVVFEVPMHGVLATYYHGIETGFFLYVLLTILTALLTPFLARRARLGLSGFFVLVLAFSCTYSVLFGPVSPLSTEASAAFFAVNALALPLLMALVMALYEWIADQAEENLIESRRRTEITNRSLETVSKQLSKYISPQLYRAILSGEQEVKVESQRKKLTVFFSDIVGFTETTDQLQSEELTSILNEYLTEMSHIAQSHGATLDKFIGDAIVLYFGDPETEGTKQDAAACVRMAIEMQERMKTLQSTWRDRGLDRPFHIRIGINTGFCTVGNFGSSDRMDYTIIGGEVNLAARLESMAEPGGILMSNETYQLVKNWVTAEEAEKIRVKGLSQPVTAYRVCMRSEETSPCGDKITLTEPAFSVAVDQKSMSAAERKDAATKLRSIAKLLDKDVE